MKRSWDGLRSVIEQRTKRSLSFGDTTAEQRRKHQQVVVHALCEVMRREDTVQRYLTSTSEPKESEVVYLLNGANDAPAASRTTHDARRILDSVVNHT